MSEGARTPHPILDPERLQRIALNETPPCFTLNRPSASVLAGTFLLMRSTLSDVLDAIERLDPEYCEKNGFEQTTDAELNDIVSTMRELLA